LAQDYVLSSLTSSRYAMKLEVVVLALFPTTALSGLLCTPFEVCKCESKWDETGIKCANKTCTYALSAPTTCCAPGMEGITCDHANCRMESTTWEDCEWANFGDSNKKDLTYPMYNAKGETITTGAKALYPDDGLFVSVPEITFSCPTPDGAVVLTDADDTIKCSGGGVAGADEVCLETTIHGLYPGVAEFQLALARGVNNNRYAQSIIPLSARPSELSMFLAMKKTSKDGKAYKKTGEKQCVQTPGNGTWGIDVEMAQYGSVFDSGDFATPVESDLTRFDRLGYRKYNNWKKVAPKFKKMSVFVGDNGQGDALAAQMMLKRSEGLPENKGKMRASFIHDVIRKCKDSTCRKRWAKHGIHLFSHYPDAAAQALALGFISKEGCAAVCDAAPKLKCTCSNVGTPCRPTKAFATFFANCSVKDMVIAGAGPSAKVSLAFLGAVVMAFSTVLAVAA